jgi:hypothetical protein
MVEPFEDQTVAMQRLKKQKAAAVLTAAAF